MRASHEPAQILRERGCRRPRDRRWQAGAQILSFALVRLPPARASLELGTPRFTLIISLEVLNHLRCVRIEQLTQRTSAPPVERFDFFRNFVL